MERNYDRKKGKGGRVIRKEENIVVIDKQEGRKVGR